MTKHIGILTSGGDSPGLNAAIRGLGKAAQQDEYDLQIIGFKDGFRGLVNNRSMPLDQRTLSGLLTVGGTILGTSREKPHRMIIGGQIMDMTDAIVENYASNHLDGLVCLGGGGTQKNALRLANRGLNVITLPKTIDNDVAMTDMTFGFDTALGIATEAIDRLHSTAHSHHRIIVVEIMGHRAGWLALGAGIAGGADVILIPEIPYDINKVAEAISHRVRLSKPFSIVAVAEGALPIEEAAMLKQAEDKKLNANDKVEKQTAKAELTALKASYANQTLRLSSQLEALTGLESRVTILGHLQRGGTPSAADRILASHLGTACAEYIRQDQYGIMIASKGMETVPVPLSEVAGKRKLVPVDHPWIDTARRVSTNFGDR